MANAQSFPLLRLPCLARGHVVMIMDIREQYLFSTLSKKSKNVTKNGVRQLRYVFELELFTYAVQFNIKKESSSEQLSITIHQIEEEEWDVNYIPLNIIIMKVEDIREKSIELLIYLKELFKMVRFVLDCNRTPNDFIKQFLTTVKNLKIPVHKLDVGNKEDQDNETYEWILKNCRDVKKLKIRYGTTPDFKFDAQQPFTFDNCHLYEAFWLTLDHMTRLFWDCRLFTTWKYDYKMTDRDFNQFIKLWIEGGSKLEYVDIPVNESTNFQEVMTDIEKVPVENAYIENCPTNFSPGSAFKIQRKNGQEAVVCHVYKVEFVLTTHFDEKDCDLWTVYDSSDEEDTEDDENDDEGEEEEDADSDN
ncbi:unnamed protein product [Caenorhabditis brenneri]